MAQDEKFTHNIEEDFEHDCTGNDASFFSNFHLLHNQDEESHVNFQDDESFT